MANSSSVEVETIMEEREEIMVPPTGGNPTLRTAHFLNPTFTSSIRDLPSLFLSSNPTISELNKAPLKVEFMGRRRPQNRWSTWVERLRSAYQHIWKKAGIYDAILASTYQTLRHNDLVIGLAQRWCVDTNTFIFPWGEVTITLEDIEVLGGYSVLGYPVFNPLQTQDLIEIKECLSKAHADIRLGSAGMSSHSSWMDHFMGSGGPAGLFEHEAFLALWLSRYVFPFHSQTVRRCLFPIAIHLSRGTPIALAPAVLASIYRDLNFLKKSMIALIKCEGDNAMTRVTVWAPFQLLQLWAWERFPTLRPNPKPIKCGEPRMARWHKVKRLKVENVGMAMDTASECFQWRPYATVVNNWMFPTFYRETEEWVLVKSVMDRELESFVQCLRACELVGLDSIEQYLPHRVAMQFGMDQDVPGYVTRSNGTPEIAWRNYNRPIKDAKLYIPYRLFESDVTKRYSEWWKQSMLACQNEIKGVVKTIDHDLLPNIKYQNFSPSAVVHGGGRIMESHVKLIEMSMKDKTLMGAPKGAVEDADVSERSLSMRVNNNEEESFSHDSCEIPRLELEQSMLACQDAIKGVVRTTSDHKLLLNTNSQNSSPLGVVCGAGRNMVVKPVEMSMQDKTLMGKPKGAVADADVSEGRSLSMRVNNNEEESFSHESSEIPGLELEQSILACQDAIKGVVRTTSGHKLLPNTKSQNSSPLGVVSGASRNMESPVKPIEMSMQEKTLMGRPKGAVEDANVSKGRSLPMRANNNEEESFSHDSSEIPRLELEQSVLACQGAFKGVVRTASDHNKLPPNTKSQNLSPLDVVSGASKNMESPVKPIEMSVQDKTLMGRPEGAIEVFEDADVSEGRSLSMRVNNNEEESFIHDSYEIPRLELEDRISKLEKLVGELKAAKFGSRLTKKPATDGLTP